MSDSESERWTQVDRGLCADHIQKLNSPRPAQCPTHAAVSLEETLEDYRTVVQGIALLNSAGAKLAVLVGKRLSDLASRQTEPIRSWSGPGGKLGTRSVPEKRH